MRITMETNYVGEERKWGATADHWRCTLRNETNGKTMDPISFWMGLGLRSKGRWEGRPVAPTVASVLSCLLSDAGSVEECPDWLDWAEDMGMLDAADADDLRRARTSYAEITEQATALRQLLGADDLRAMLDLGVNDPEYLRVDDDGAVIGWKEQ